MNDYFSTYGVNQDIKVHLGTKTGEIQMVNYYSFINGSFPCCCYGNVINCNVGTGEPYVMVCKNGPIKNNFMLQYQGGVQIA